MGSTLLTIVSLPLFIYAFPFALGGTSYQVFKYSKNGNFLTHERLKRNLKHKLLILFKEKHELLRKIIHLKLQRIKITIDMLAKELNNNKKSPLNEL